MGLTATAPSFYAEKGVPKVRWMYPGKAYKARYIKVPYRYDEAKMFVYVLSDKYVIAYRDEAMTDEIGMLKLKHFELVGHLETEEAPVYSSVFPVSFTYGMLLDGSYTVQADAIKLEKVMETAQKITEPVQSEPLSTHVGRIEEESAPVKVAILPPDPPVEYEQLVLF